MEPIITSEEIKALMADIRVFDGNPKKAPLREKDSPWNSLPDQLATFENCVILSDQYELILWINEDFLIMTRKERETLRKNSPKSSKTSQHDNDITQIIWKTVLGGKTFTANLPDQNNHHSPCQYEVIIIPIHKPTALKISDTSRISMMDNPQ
ncbi:MAG: hypothetical protein ACYCVG_06475 [Leptospirillum sp.]|jgi:hypothetical protein